MDAPKDPSLSRIVTEDDIRFYVQQFKKSGFRYTEWRPEQRRGWSARGAAVLRVQDRPGSRPHGPWRPGCPASLPPVVGGSPSALVWDGSPPSTFWPPQSRCF